MRSETELRDGMWNDLIDRDLNLLIDGKPPFNDDLAPLESFVITLTDFAEVPVPPEFIEYHASEAATRIQPGYNPTIPSPLPRRRKLMFTLKRRVAAAATSLMMIIGMTGVAWAADSAVPGDWNYGIDRALEAIGIGNGGADERLTELAISNGEENPGRSQSPWSKDSVISDDESSAASDEPGGLANAAATVSKITPGSENANQTRVAVSTLLAYLASTGEIDGQTVADYAKQIRPENAGKPAETGKP